jgi:hypothetical protein
MKPVKLTRAWFKTTDAAAMLGVSKDFLLEQRGRLFLKGKHWKVLNPRAYRPTYLWHVRNCEQRQMEE